MYKTVAVNDAGLRIGEDHPQARYTNHEIDLVLELRDEGRSYGYLCVRSHTSRAAWPPVRDTAGLRGKGRIGLRGIQVGDLT